jgi:hypothetical protein
VTSQFNTVISVENARRLARLLALDDDDGTRDEQEN